MHLSVKRLFGMLLVSNILALQTPPSRILKAVLQPFVQQSY